MSAVEFTPAQMRLISRSPQYLQSELCSILDHNFIGIRADETGWHTMCKRCGLHQFEERTA